MAELTIPTDVKQDTDRGRSVMRKNAPARRLCARFERGDTYTYLTGKNQLTELPTVTNPGGGGKPPHRLRNKYNFIRPIVDAKVSAATQRIPSYEITPTSTDPTEYSAATLAEDVARYGYDKWMLRKVGLKTTKLAIGHGGVGYALPYFDPNVGPYQHTEDGGEAKGLGEIKVLVLSGNEVYSQVGVDFDYSPWYVVERARPIGEVTKIPGFIRSIKLAPDAASSDIAGDRATDNLVMVSEYFERPSQRFPDGRCMVWANGRPIVDYRQLDPTSQVWWGPYPLEDHQGLVLDEPILHRLVYAHDPETDNDFGLTWQLIDFQRTAQDCVNKMLEWKNRCLNPQMKAPLNSLVDIPDDVPGAIRYYRPVNGLQPEWERPPDMPQALFQILDWAVTAMQQVAADQQVDPAPNISARTLNTGIEQSMNRWQSFLGDLAEWHSRLMRHCLLLVARNYTTPRLLKIRGRDGFQLISDFTGTQLMGQAQVRVLPDSLAPVTRSGVQEQITWINQNWPGFLNPDAALQAIQSGSLDRLTQSYWLDVGRANLVIQKIIDGSVMDMPDRVEMHTDPTTGMEVQVEVPSFMPDQVDNLNVWKSMFSDFLKTDQFQRLEPGRQEVGKLIWQGIQDLEAQQQQRKIEQQNAIAAELGASNAAKPQAKGMPSLPGGNEQMAA